MADQQWIRGGSSRSKTRWETISLGIRGFAKMNLDEIDAASGSFLNAIQCSKRFMDSVLVIYPLIGMA